VHQCNVFLSSESPTHEYTVKNTRHCATSSSSGQLRAWQNGAVAPSTAGSGVQKNLAKYFATNNHK